MSLFLVAIAIGANGLLTTPVIATPEYNQVIKPAQGDPVSVVMKDGKIWLTKEGKTEILAKEIVLGTTVVKPDGSVYLQNGQIVNLKEGDRVTADGKVITMVDQKKDSDMYPEK